MGLTACYQIVTFVGFFGIRLTCFSEFFHLSSSLRGHSPHREYVLVNWNNCKSSDSLHCRLQSGQWKCFFSIHSTQQCQLSFAITQDYLCSLEYWCFEILVILAGLLPNPKLELATLSVWYSHLPILYFSYYRVFPGDCNDYILTICYL